MSVWYPYGGLSYSQYLQAKSVLGDITSSFENQISQQTESLIANDNQLATAFSVNFDKTNRSIDWGFDRLENGIGELNASVESLHASFDYSIGLLIEKIDVNNKQLSSLLNKIDCIQKTLDSPTLTSAREFYKIGCERLSKGLLDKSLEAFLEAEKRNDTDFFIQYRIGKLFLFGIDEDDNLLNLEKAKHHLLRAARYAKAEIPIDPAFKKYAADALLHASIAVYAQLAEDKALSDESYRNTLLDEASKLASDALAIFPTLSEANYHLAKYYAHKNIPEHVVANLEKAILIDRNYTIKAEIDHSFDSLRSLVSSLFLKLHKSKKDECEPKLSRVKILYASLLTWNFKIESRYEADFNLLSDDLNQAEFSFNTGTYYGLLDSARLLDHLLKEIPGLEIKRKKEIQANLQAIKDSIPKEMPQLDSLSTVIDDGIAEIRDFLATSEKEILKETYESYKKAKELLSESLSKAKLLKQLQTEKQEQRQREAEEEERRRQSQLQHNKWSIEYAGQGASSCAVIGGIIGLITCAGRLGTHSEGGLDLFSGGILGAIIGAVFGAIYGQIKNKY